MGLRITHSRLRLYLSRDRRYVAFCVALAVTTMSLYLHLSAEAMAAAPAVCGGTAQIVDASGDGHHPNTDVLRGWFSESDSGIKAVIEVYQAVWEPVHDDSDQAGFAMLFSVGSETRYVRAIAPPYPDPVRYDYGTWTRLGGFQTAGTTTGSATTGFHGYAVIDIPASVAGTNGGILKSPFILTWDGVNSGEPHWVDRAPGGVTPDDGAERGADFTVGTCTSTPPAVTDGVSLSVPTSVVGGGNITVGGKVNPARAGVNVRVQVSGRTSQFRDLVTSALGEYSTSVPISETSNVRAEADGISSGTRTVTVRSSVSLSVSRLNATTWQVSGSFKPALPGHVLLLRTNAYMPTAATTTASGRFRFVLRKPAKARYQAVYIPFSNRAERSTSNQGVIK
jgi:hypothetical protein